MSAHLTRTVETSSLRRAIAGFAAALAVAACVTAAPSALAQSDPRYQTVAFVHGFNADGSTWDSAKRRLADEFAIDARNPTLEWRALWQTQAGRLRGNVPADVTNIVTVGHSNGGQISRVYNREYYQTGTAINDRMVLVTSLNRGAPLVDKVLSGHVQSELVGGATHMVNVWNYYVYMESARRGYVPFSRDMRDALQILINYSYRIELALARMGFVEEAVAAVVAPDLLDMSPTRSAYYRDTPLSLNSPANLAREAGSIWSRVAIYGDYRDVGDPFRRPNGIFFATFFDDNVALALETVRYFAYEGSMAAYEYYRYRYNDPNPNYIGLRQNALEWLFIANRLANFDVWWLRMIGALGEFNPYARAWQWIPSDGILPITTQTYPSATLAFTNGHTHTKQTGSDEVYRRLRQAFPVMGIRTRDQTVASVEIQPRNATLAAGQLQALTLVVKNLNGGTITRTAQWTSSNPNVATVRSSDNLLSAHAQGTTTVRATIDGISDEIPVSVGPPLPPPVTPFTGVTIVGSTSVPSTCPTGYWQAIISDDGAPGPFSYAWTINRSAAGANQPSLTGEGTAPSFTVGVRVRQLSTGVEYTAKTTVTVHSPSWSAVPCISTDL